MIRAALALGALGAVIGAGCAKASPAGGPAARAAPSRRATFSLDCAAPGHEISPLVYGIGATDEPDWVWQLGATARRWGGNGASRYNWELGNAWNTNHDWFFRNLPVSRGRPGYGYETFLEENRAHGVASELTVPMLGWVAKDTTSYAFPVSVVGPQHATAPDLSDAGDGLRPDGTPLPAAPERTSVRSTPASVERWVRAIRARDREVGARRVRAYVLDNEPMLWHETHRDVRTEPLGYDELLERTIAYASAIRRADPGATIAGPAAWGWLEYHDSAVDRRAGWLRPDRRRHGDLPLLAWYLREVAAHERRTGTRLLDVVDIHFYPANDAIGTSERGGTDPATAALRIRATRSLWDATYVDESWVGEKMRVIPLVKEWIARYHPGLGLSIGEWNFGAERHMSGGLAVAEALGRFGVDGLQSAYYWTYPPLASPAWWAFRAYRNFDGEGGRFLDRSVPVKGGAPLASLFASSDGGAAHGAGPRHLVLVLLNQDPAAPLAARVELGGCGRVTAARALAYAGGDGGFRPAELAAAGGAVEIEAAPYAITVLDLTLAR